MEVLMSNMYEDKIYRESQEKYFSEIQDLDSFVQQTVQKLKFQKGTFPWTLGLSEICAEDPNFKIKTWVLGF